LANWVAPFGSHSQLVSGLRRRQEADLKDARNRHCPTRPYRFDRLAKAERMTLDEYRRDLAERDKVRACYAELRAECRACISLSAPAAAPLGWTRRAIQTARSMFRCSASRLSRSPCWMTKGCRSACKSRDSLTVTPKHLPWRPLSTSCSNRRGYNRLAIKPARAVFVA
jgi:hypothetical protein